MSITFEDIFIHNNDISELLLFDYFDNNIVINLRSTSHAIAQKTLYYFVNSNIKEKIYRIKSDNYKINDVEWKYITVEMLDIIINEKIYIGAIELLLILFGNTDEEICRKAQKYISNDSNFSKYSLDDIRDFKSELKELIKNSYEVEVDIDTKLEIIRNMFTEELVNYIFKNIVLVIYNKAIFEEYCNRNKLDDILYGVSSSNTTINNQDLMIKHLILKYGIKRINKLGRYYRCVSVTNQIILFSENGITPKIRSSDLCDILYDLDDPYSYKPIIVKKIIMNLENRVDKTKLLNDKLYLKLVKLVNEYENIYDRCVNGEITEFSDAYTFDIIEELDNSSVLKYYRMDLDSAQILAEFLVGRYPNKYILRCVDWLLNKFPFPEISDIIGCYANLSTIIKLNIPIKQEMLYGLRFDVIKYIVDNYSNFVYCYRFAYELFNKDKKFIGSVLKYMHQHNINMVKFMVYMGSININYYLDWIGLFGEMSESDCKRLLESEVLDYELLDYRPKAYNMGTDGPYFTYSFNNLRYGGFTPYESPFPHDDDKPAACLAKKGYIKFNKYIEDYAEKLDNDRLRNKLRYEKKCKIDIN